MPGRKTDVKDAEWLVDLLCHGLLRPSFVPPKAIRELRDLTRYRRKLVQSQAAERNRLPKLLESANIKLASVATDVFGVSGRLMLRALIEGKASPREVAELAKRKLRSKIPELELALELKSGVKSGPFIRICLKTAHLHAKFMQQSIKASQSWLQPASDFNL